MEKEEVEEEKSIIFSHATMGELIKITKGKFYWKGEEVTDAHKIYERFNKWLKSAEKTKI